jgi:hypothetical protein
MFLLKVHFLRVSVTELSNIFTGILLITAKNLSVNTFYHVKIS